MKPFILNIRLTKWVLLSGMAFYSILAGATYEGPTSLSCDYVFSDVSKPTLGSKIYARTKKDVSRFKNISATLLRTISNLKDIRELEFLSEIIILAHPQSHLMRSVQRAESLTALSEDNELFTTGAHFRIIQGTTPLSAPLIQKNIQDEYSTVTITHNPESDTIEFSVQSNSSFSDYDLQLQRYNVDADWSELQPYFSASRKDVLFTIGKSDKIVKVNFSKADNKLAIETESEVAGVKTRKNLVIQLSENKNRMDSIYYSEQGRRTTLLFPFNYHTQYEFKLLPFL